MPEAKGLDFNGLFNSMFKITRLLERFVEADHGLADHVGVGLVLGHEGVPGGVGGTASRPGRINVHCGRHVGQGLTSRSPCRGSAPCRRPACSWSDRGRRTRPGCPPPPCRSPDFGDRRQRDPRHRRPPGRRQDRHARHGSALRQRVPVENAQPVAP